MNNRKIEWWEDSTGKGIIVEEKITFEGEATIHHNRKWYTEKVFISFKELEKINKKLIKENE